jgi:dTMP kinase
MGKLIVLEGTDGSGKATQCAALYEALMQQGVSCKKIEFPRYDQDSSALIRMYLGGEFGDKPSDVNAWAASTFYAVDRYASYKQDWGEFYENGGLVIADRYTTSNAVHQASKLPEAERSTYLDWLFDTEYRLFGLPKPDLVFYLDMPTEITERMMRQREANTGTHADIHEQDADYLRQCRANAKAVAKSSGWTVIHCAKDDAPRTPEDIHREILDLVKELL